MKNLILLLIVSVTLAAGCSKDQKVVRQIDGKWKTVEMKYNGVEEDPANYQGVNYIFEKCKVSKQDCDGFIDMGGIGIPFTYSIYEDGSKMRMTITIFGITETQTGDIVDVSKSKLRLKTVDDNGDVAEVTLEKV